MLEKQIRETVKYIKGKTGILPEAAIVLGSGLGGFADSLEDAVILPYEEIPGFAVSTAPGHKGQMVLGKKKGRYVLCLQGRFHYYEGYTMAQIVYPVRVIKALGTPKLILTNSCGGLNPNFKPGDFMLITDHINFMQISRYDKGIQSGVSRKSQSLCKDAFHRFKRGSLCGIWRPEF